MKISLYKTLIIFLLFSCGTNNDEIQKTWIGKYEVQHSDTEGERINQTPLKHIIQIQEDSFIIKRFPIDFFDNESSIRISQEYKIIENKILTSTDTFTIQNIFSDSLIISFKTGYTKRTIYEELERYNQAERADELFELLTSNTFTIMEDTIIIEFQKNGKYVSPNFNYGRPGNRLWIIDTFENELFLVFNGISGVVIQIENFNSNQVRGKIYYKNNIEVIWNKLENEIGFKISQLLGEWEKIQEPIPPFLTNEKEHYDKETLKVAKNNLIRYEGFKKDTFNWEFNRGKNIILFTDFDSVKKGIGNHWNINSIENDTLTLERKGSFFGGWGANVDLSRFIRKK